MLAPVVDDAVHYWRNQGADVSQLHHTDVVIADLSSSLLGVASSRSNTIQIDHNAAGHGWMNLDSPSGGNAIDLLSVVTHEFGHLLGYDHDILGESLQLGMRHLPSLHGHHVEPGDHGHDAADQVFASWGQQNRLSQPEADLFGHQRLGALDKLHQGLSSDETDDAVWDPILVNREMSNLALAMSTERKGSLGVAAFEDPRLTSDDDTDPAVDAAIRELVDAVIRELTEEIE